MKNNNQHRTKCLLSVSFLICSLFASSQDFTKYLADARTAYGKGQLEETRFSLQQMMQQLDKAVTQEIIALLPGKMDSLVANKAKDEVESISSLMGTTLKRVYMSESKSAPAATVELEITLNSPVQEWTKNTMAAAGLLFKKDEVRIKGYKAEMIREEGESGKSQFELHLPINKSLVVLRAPSFSREQIISLANFLPIESLAEKLR